VSADVPGGTPAGTADGTPDPGGTSGDELAEETGVDAVRAALNRARAAAAARGLRPGDMGSRSGGSASGRARRRIAGERRSGAGPDARDPQMVSANIARLVVERGWSTPVAVGGVLGRWDSVVGADVAAHCRPVSFTEGVLTVAADSSAWATQVRLLLPTVMRRLAEEVGEGTVERIVVRGPAAPSWKRGPRVAPGSQGPRDTYG
jgi:predicted nucleic acid-binding Zn ribbon protein